jgi:hypothetical protein
MICFDSTVTVSDQQFDRPVSAEVDNARTLIAYEETVIAVTGVIQCQFRALPRKAVIGYFGRRQSRSNFGSEDSE